MEYPIFLSAGIPPMDSPYYQTINIQSVRDAIAAFTYVCAEYNIPFFFGGHPAITPLIYEVALNNNIESCPKIKIYQSNFFKKECPKEVQYYDLIKWTRKKGDRKGSIDSMREIMFSENKVKCAVFIGGKEGVIEEQKLIISKYKDCEILPIASTGGAALEIYKKGNNNNNLLDNFAYVSLFMKLLEQYKNENT